MHSLLTDTDYMLSAGQFSQLEGRVVHTVTRDPLTSQDSLSGSRLEAISTRGAGGERRYVLKRINYDWDWIMRATHDTQGRAVTAWQYGLLDALPACIKHAYIACSTDGDGWAILMHDVSELLIPPGNNPISREQNNRFLDHMAQFHAAFWGQTQWAGPKYGFCDLRTRYSSLTPRVADRESGGPDPTPQMVGMGWYLLEDSVAPDVASIVRPLLDNPTPLARTLGAYPQTVVHHDWKLGNLGITHDQPEPRTILLDWAQPGIAPPACDLAWYLAVNSACLPLSKEDCIDIYKGHLAAAIGNKFAPIWWEPQLALALLGGFILLGWPKLLGANQGDPATQQREQAELQWWSEWIRKGAALITE